MGHHVGYTPQSGKVILANNAVRTTTSGMSVDGGAGEIKTTHESLEKIRIALFEGGELNVEFESDSLFSVGHIATIISRNGYRVAISNQTTKRWLTYKIGLSGAERLTLLVVWLIAAYYTLLTVLRITNPYTIMPEPIAWIPLQLFGFSGVVPLMMLVVYGAIAVAATVFAVKYKRNKTKARIERVQAIDGEQQRKYAAEIDKSRAAYKAMVDSL